MGVVADDPAFKETGDLMSGELTPRGRFITLEGIDRAGKSTHVPALASAIEALGYRVLTTREPGGSALGESIRGLLLDPALPAMAPSTELLLMFAARAEHLECLIKPALVAGTWVICDRFSDASYAYQGAGRGIPTARIAALEDFVQGTLRPDLTLILDIPLSLSLERAGRHGSRDRIEGEDETFFARVRDCYLSRARDDPQRYRVVDATPPKDTVHRALLAHIGSLSGSGQVQ